MVCPGLFTGASLSKSWGRFGVFERYSMQGSVISLCQNW